MMDLLAVRWANPFLILDEFIRLHQLHDMLKEVTNNIADEKIRQARWEFYLHKICFTSDMSFDEYCRMCDNQTPKEADEMPHEKIGKILDESKRMLNGFAN